MEEEHVNTPQQIVHRYMDGFRRSDHDAILECLNDDVVWSIHGFRTTHGKAEFDDEIENPAFEGSPELTVERTIDAGDVVVVTGLAPGTTARTDASDSPTATCSRSATASSRRSTPTSSRSPDQVGERRRHHLVEALCGRHGEDWLTAGEFGDSTSARTSPPTARS
jgi:ketosteroid isomerase-like protein